MNVKKMPALLILTAILIIGCSSHKGNPSNSRAAQDGHYRYVRSLCEQEAEARCWRPVGPDPLYVNEIKAYFAQSGCMKDWISGCMEKHGYASLRD